MSTGCHIYLDNCSWRYLPEKQLIKIKGQSDFQITEDHINALKKGIFKPILSEENYREFGKSLIGSNKDSREKSKSILRFMISRAWPRVFSEKDILIKDFENMVSGRKGNYFMEQGRARTLRNAFIRPHDYLQIINGMAKNCETQKHGFTDSISHLINRTTNTREGLIANGNLGDLDENDFQRLFKAFCRSQTTRTFIKGRLRALGIRRRTKDVAYFFTCINKSRVLGGFLKHLCAFILHRIKTGRIRIDANDVLDRRHYMMSGFCKYFITDDRPLKELLKLIPKEYRHVEVMSLPEFIEGPLAKDS